MIARRFKEEKGDGSMSGPDNSGSNASPGSRSISKPSRPARRLRRVKRASLSRKVADLMETELRLGVASRWSNRALACTGSSSKVASGPIRMLLRFLQDCYFALVLNQMPFPNGHLQTV